MKDKKQDVRQNAKIEDKKLKQVQGGVCAYLQGAKNNAPVFREIAK